MNFITARQNHANPVQEEFGMRLAGRGALGNKSFANNPTALQ